jgi:hypothetical protein
MRKAFFSPAAILLLTSIAHAQSAATEVQDFGLVGTWAVECKDLPSPQNEHASFSVNPSGGVQLRNDFGRDYDEMVYRIISARRIAPDRVELRQVLTTDRRIVLDTVMLKEEDRLRLWSSRGLDGTTLVADGTVPMTNGQQTRWTDCCQGRWTHDGARATDIRFVPKR